MARGINTQFSLYIMIHILIYSVTGSYLGKRLLSRHIATSLDIIVQTNMESDLDIYEPSDLDI